MSEAIQLLGILGGGREGLDILFEVIVSQTRSVISTITVRKVVGVQYMYIMHNMSEREDMEVKAS